MKSGDRRLVDPDDGYIASIGEYSLGDAMAATTALLQIIAEDKGVPYANRLDQVRHSGITECVIAMVNGGSSSRIEEMFLALATGVDLVFSIISAIDKADFMADVESFGRDEE